MGLVVIISIALYLLFIIVKKIFKIILIFCAYSELRKSYGLFKSIVFLIAGIFITNKILEKI